jgi:hypothetical protein
MPDKMVNIDDVEKYIQFIRSFQSVMKKPIDLDVLLYQIFDILPSSENVLGYIRQTSLTLDEYKYEDEPSYVKECRKFIEEEIEHKREKAKSKSMKKNEKNDKDLKDSMVNLNWITSIIEKNDEIKRKIKHKENIKKHNYDIMTKDINMLNRKLKNNGKKEIDIDTQNILNTAKKIVTLQKSKLKGVGATSINPPEHNFKDVSGAQLLLLSRIEENYNKCLNIRNTVLQLKSELDETGDWVAEKKKIESKIKDIKEEIQKNKIQLGITIQSINTRYDGCKSKIEEYERINNIRGKHQQIGKNIHKILRKYFLGQSFKDVIKRVMEKLKSLDWTRFKSVAIAKCNIATFEYNFDSKGKNECSLEEYHSFKKGKDCQYIGFFDKSYDSDIFNHFDISGNNLIFIDISRIPITQINSEEQYITYNKNANLCLKLNYARYQVDIVKTTNGEVELIDRRPASFKGLPGEHVMIYNNPVNIEMMEIEYYEDDLIESIFVERGSTSKNVLKNFIIRSMLDQELHKYRGIDVNKTTYKGEQNGGAMKIKYLKYKQKYLGLKNIIEKFNKL